LIVPRSLFTVTNISNKLYAVGGFSNQGILAYPAIEFYSPDSDIWSELKIDEFGPRTNHGTVASNGKLIVFGGQSHNETIKSMHLINVETNEKEEIKPVEGERVPTCFSHFLSNDNDSIVVFGGVGNSVVYLYKVSENKWTSLESLSKNLIEVIQEDVVNNEKEILT
jgi:N-acetylneuraminic acid mutarotase